MKKQLTLNQLRIYALITGIVFALIAGSFAFFFFQLDIFSAIECFIYTFIISFVIGAIIFSKNCPDTKFGSFYYNQPLKKPEKNKFSDVFQANDSSYEERWQRIREEEESFDHWHTFWNYYMDD